MIVIAGKIQIDPANAEQAVAAAVEMMAATEKEEGCISYTFSRDLREPGGFRIFEEWETDEALKAHFTMSHMAEFQKVVGGLGVREMTIQRYEVSSVGPLG